MLRETLKLEIDRLSEEQLEKVADFIAAIKEPTRPPTQALPFWQKATPEKRAWEFRAWVAQLPRTHKSLPDEACDRGSIYDE